MSASKRQMHLGVFVLGTGNHSAGWRYDGATTQLQPAGDAVHRRASPSAASSTCSSSPTPW